MVLQHGRHRCHAAQACRLRKVNVGPEIQAVRGIWDNGLELPFEGISSAEVWDFRQRTSATRVVFVAWVCEGIEHRSTYPAELLPDRSGLVRVADVDPGKPFPTIRRKLEVIHADGSLRCVVHPPVIDERSVPAKAWLDTPRSFGHLGVPFGVPASDGWRWLVMDIDWQTGKMLRWVLAPNLDR